MTDSITPPPELVQQLYGLPQMRAIEKAYQAGADQELEACLANIHTMYGKDKADWLRAMRRPRPPSLKEQALEALDRMDQFPNLEDRQIVRRALEQLDD